MWFHIASWIPKTPCKAYHEWNVARGLEICNDYSRRKGAVVGGRQRRSSEADSASPSEPFACASNILYRCSKAVF
jgi:hypothetical protein